MPPFDMNRPPDQVACLTAEATVPLVAAGEGRYEGGGIELDAEGSEGTLSLRLRTNVPLLWVRLRWAERIPEGLRYLGDAWDRREHSLEWRCLVPERPLPWYFLAHDGQHTHGVGVQTGPAALCHWRVDPYGVTLWLDVRNGAGPVEPGDRELHLADIAVRSGRVWEAPFLAARRFAALLDTARLMPEQPVYGFNCEGEAGPWDAEHLLASARLLADLAENTVNRPFFMVASGWQEGGPAHGTVRMQPRAGMGNMEALASAIADTTCHPGLWLRPLLSMSPEHEGCALPKDRSGGPGGGWLLDPTHPEAIALVQQAVEQAVAWGYGLICHDDVAEDLLGDRRGRPGSRSGEGWRFHDTTLTTAEVLRQLYQSLRQAAGDRPLIVGRNTLGHLAAGHVHVQHIVGSQTARQAAFGHLQGIKALAFRGFHHGALYAAEADPVCLYSRVPWALNQHWLSLLASSGTPCFVAPGIEPPDETVQRALRAAFSQASRQLSLAEPLDWLVTTSPGRWKLANETVSYDWFSAQYDESFSNG
jgi:alpha-galactosidase